MALGPNKFNNGILLTPISAPSGSNGQMYYDSSTNKLRSYENGAFVNVNDVSGKPLNASNILVGNGSNVSVAFDTTGGTSHILADSTNGLTIKSSVITNAMVSASAAIAYSKLNLSGSIVNADIASAAAIAYSKLSLSNSIVNADINSAAAIAYSKLSLTGSIVNADIASAAAIAHNKMAALSASLVAVTDASGFVTTSSVTTTTLGFLDATSSIQTQLNNKLSLSGGTMSGVINMGSNKITSLTDPTNPQDAATKNYVDNSVTGLSWKQAVRAASAGSNITISSAPASIDGVTLVANDRVLLKDQSTASQNGIYIFNGTGSAMTRSADMDTWNEVVGAVMLVTEGSTNVGSKWVNTNVAGGTLGTTSITFVAFSVAGTVSGSGASGQVAFWNGSSSLSGENQLAQSRGGFGTNVSAFTGVLKASSGTFSASALVDADVSATAAISLSKLAALTANKAVATNASGVLVASATTDTELGFVSGVTSSIQTQLNGKASTALSNLASTAVNADILPDATANARNIGSFAKSFNNIYAGTFQVSDSTNTYAKLTSFTTPSGVTNVGGIFSNSGVPAGMITPTVNATSASPTIYIESGNNINAGAGANSGDIKLTTGSVTGAGVRGGIYLSGVGINNNGAAFISTNGQVKSSALTNGQILVGSTGADPVATTITAGSGISVTNGAGSITITASGTSGVTTIGTLDSQTKSANGAVITGVTLVLQTADATNPGLVSTGAQTFAGVKTFSSAPVISTITNTGTLTLPTSTDTLVGRATSDTLTNKTIAAGSNTITGLTNSNLSGTAGITGANIATNTVANSNLSQMAANTLKGNNTGGTANAADLTVAQVNTMLGVIADATGDIGLTSFTDTTDIRSNVSVTGFAFANGTVRSFRALCSVTVSATTTLYEEFDLMGIQRGADWVLSSSSNGDNSTVTFSITSAGQVQYSKPTTAGFTQTKMSFRAIVTQV